MSQFDIKYQLLEVVIQGILRFFIHQADQIMGLLPVG